MSDYALKWDGGQGAADLAVTANDLAVDDGLETAILLSLFTDREAGTSDVLPDATGDRRGWWGDLLADVDGDKMGSRLWLLSRAKPTADTLRNAETYAREALAWLLEDKVASTVDVAAAFTDGMTLSLTVAVRRPSGTATSFQYNYTWNAELSAGR